MNTIAHPNNTEQLPVDPVNDPTLDPDSYWKAYNVCQLGQEMPPEIVQIMADSATNAVHDWLKSINAPQEVRDLYGEAEMLTIYDQKLSAGRALSAGDGAELLATMVSAGKNMRAVGAKFCYCGIPNALPGTLPKFQLTERPEI